MKTMSEKEFFRLVPKTGWKLNKTGEMRRRIAGKKAEFCPVTAVAYRKLGAFFNEVNYDAAADEMGLDARFAADVVAAADTSYSSPMRRKLLKHTRLTESKETN